MTVALTTDIRVPIEQAISAAFPSTPIAWPSSSFDPPDALWIRPFVAYGGEALAAMRRDQLVGSVVVEVFVPLSTGTAAVQNAIDTIKGVFFRQKINNIHFPDIQAIRQLENEAYYGMAIDISFQAYSTS